MERKKINSTKLPDAPGVYFFLGNKKEILYIGKATSLRTRIRSYFDGAIAEKRSSAIEKMVQEAKKIEWTETDSVLEALLLETNLIRTHKPKYNTRSKDDKSYNHVVITKEEFPRVLVVRGKDLNADTANEEYQYVFGPFPQGSLFKEALKLVRKLFQFYDKDARQNAHKSKMGKGKLNFNTQIGLYPGSISAEAYAETIHHIALFFQGKKYDVIAELEQQMHRYAKQEKFEEADKVKRKIFALKHIEDVSLIKDEARTYTDEKQFRIEAYDVAHTSGKQMLGVMTVSHGGHLMPSEYRSFIIKDIDKANDPGALRQMAQRRFKHSEWRMPQLIVVDGNTVQKSVMEKVLREFQLTIPVVAVVKDEKHKPKQILGVQKIVANYKKQILEINGEAHRFSITLHRRKRLKTIRQGSK